MRDPKPRAVLIVEDEHIVARHLERLLDGFGYDPYAIASSAEEALARAAEKRPDIVLVDVKIEGRVDGIKAAQLLQERFGVPIVYLTAHSDEATLARAKQTRPYGYLLKPVKPAQLRSTIEIAIDEHEREERGSRSPAAVTGSTTPAPTTRNLRAPGARPVRRQLEQILRSEDFDASRRSREFLRFIVEEALSGRGEALSQSAIATRVFDRKDEFDPVVDPIVRIQAGRLRRSLERYYLLSGRQDPVRIELPRGGYVPAFVNAPVAEKDTIVQPAEAESGAPSDDWPRVVVGRFESGSAGTELDQVASIVNEGLTLELARYADVRVVLQEELGRPEAAGRPGARFALDGRVRPEDGGWQVAARLVDRTTGEQVWGDMYHTVPQPGRWSGSPEDIARVVAARVAAEEGVIVQLLAAEQRKGPPAEPTAYGAILRSYDFFLARDPEALAPALVALRQVVAREPECGPAWTRLSRLYTANYAFEVTAIPTPIDEAIDYGQNGVRVNPTSRRARCVLATALLVKGEPEVARDELEQALRLNPDSLIYLEIIGFLLTLLGDWERGPALSRSAQERNPHCLPHVLIGLWADHLRRGEMEAAYRAALDYRDPTFFWRAMMRASCLGHLGRAAEASAAVAELLRHKPDFTARGRILLERWIKFPEVTGLVVEGLEKAGLALG